ncbi:putative colanic acid biosynthesis acetyltransferase [Rhodococcus sp. 06-221-2]|nr:putative colanic acid biosynthesis acetyltransferase [Rhodococcus sp. 06-221-2]
MTTSGLNSGQTLRSLAGFTGAGYDKGRRVHTQIMWMILSSTVFTRWWLPNRARIAILRLMGAQIGSNVLIRQNVKIHWPWKLQIGDNSWIGDGAWLLNLEKITIGHDVCISQQVLLCTGSHDRKSPTFEFDNGPIVICDGVWVATRATILRGVTLQQGCTVAAGTVVTKDVQAWTIATTARNRDL